MISRYRVTGYHCEYITDAACSSEKFGTYVILHGSITHNTTTWNFRVVGTSYR